MENKMKKVVFTATIGSVAVCSFPLYANAQAHHKANNAIDETMVVTGTRFETHLSDSLAPIEVISKEEIEALNAQSLTDILKYLPGIQVANSGGPGQMSDLFIRGFSTKYTLVLINGVRIGSATTGATNLAALPLAGVERIEVLRGPRAAVYGSDAVSGVINIITSKGAAGDNFISAGAGSFGTYKAALSVGSAVDDAWFNITAAHEQSKGYMVQPDSTNPLDKKDDGYRSNYLLLDTGQIISPELTLKLNGYYQRHHSEYANSWVGNDKVRSDLYNLALVSSWQKDQLTSELVAATNQDEGKRYGQVSTDSTIKTNRYSLSWSNKYQLNPNMAFVSGAEWYRDKVDNSSKEYLETQRDNSAIYLGHYFNYGAFNAEANFRFDRNSAYGNFTTYQLAAGYQLFESTKLIGLYGTSFKAPTFNELYYPGSDNPNLKAEKNHSAELALEYLVANTKLRASVFRNNVDDMIVSKQSTNWIPENISKARMQGYELSANFATGPIYHSASYTRLDAMDKTSGFELARRAKNSANWTMTYLVNAWQFDVNYLYQGTRFDDANNTAKLDPYSLVDTSVGYAFSQGVILRFKVANLFDKEYETAKGYKTPERNYFVSADYQW